MRGRWVAQQEVRKVRNTGLKWYLKPSSQKMTGLSRNLIGQELQYHNLNVGNLTAGESRLEKMDQQEIAGVYP